MKSSLQLNQGVPNSYTSNGISRQKKIENSFERFRKSSSMTCQTSQKNIDLYGDQSDYSDNSEDEGYFDPESDYAPEDRFIDYDQLEQWKDERPHLQDPDTMEYIRPARTMPSVVEMEKENRAVLNREIHDADK